MENIFIKLLIKLKLKVIKDCLRRIKGIHMYKLINNF